MSQFRLWQANRQVFLYPENYLLPELRTDSLPLRRPRERPQAEQLRRRRHHRGIRELPAQTGGGPHLVVAAHYRETRPDGSRILHVFARTQGTPPKWYYRSRAEGSWAPASGAPGRREPGHRSEQSCRSCGTSAFTWYRPSSSQICRSRNPGDPGVPTTTSGGSRARPASSGPLNLDERAERRNGSPSARTRRRCLLETDTSPRCLHVPRLSDAHSNCSWRSISGRREISIVHWVRRFILAGRVPALVSCGNLAIAGFPAGHIRRTPSCPPPLSTSQEPSYPLINQASFLATVQFCRSAGYGFSGQDLR